MTNFLILVPHEIILYIVAGLNFADVVSLSRTCRDFQYLFKGERVSKKILEVRSQKASPVHAPSLAAADLLIQAIVPFSQEVLDAQSCKCTYASAFRRLAKRREALASGCPFSAAIIGFGDSIIYFNGTLCYVNNELVRVLDLHRSCQLEAVVDVRELVSEAIASYGCDVSGIFRLLYYNDNILSCLYMLSNQSSRSWLFSYNFIKRKVVCIRELQSTRNIFVRNNSEYLYFGTYSDGTYPDGTSFENMYDRRQVWMLEGFSFRGQKWNDNKIYLWELIGSEIGSTLSFEIYKAHFYAVSNQTTYEVEEVDWTSFYHGTRFPLDNPSMDKLEKTQDNKMWRRQHLEGTIDDRWTNLALRVDETSGDLKIIETRKEYSSGRNSGQRITYTTDIVFPNIQAREDESLISPAVMSSSPGSTASSSFSSTTLGNSSEVSNASGIYSGITTVSSMQSVYRSSSSALLQSRITLAALTQDRLALTLTADDKPHYLAPQIRLPCNVHSETTSSSIWPFSISKVPIRHYNLSAGTFIDLVNDESLAMKSLSGQCLRLSTSSRTLGPLARTNEGLLVGETSDKLTGDVIEGLNEQYTLSPPTLWPPKQNADGSLDPHLKDLYSLLNLPSHLGNVEGFVDERSLVYIMGKKGQSRAIIFLNFDPAIRLEGLKRWEGSKEVAGLYSCKSDSQNESREKSKNLPLVGHQRHQVSMAVPIMSMDKGQREGKGKGREDPLQANNSTLPLQRLHNASRKSREGTRSGAAAAAAAAVPAMYLSIALGYDFSL